MYIFLVSLFEGELYGFRFVIFIGFLDWKFH